MTRSDVARCVVAGVDGSESDEQVLTWAAHTAHDRGANLLIVHAIDEPAAVLHPDTGDSGDLSEAELVGAKNLDRAKAIAEAAEPALEVTTLLRRQPSADLLITLSADAQLIVAGTHRVSRFIGASVGSVGQRIAAHGRCPVIVLPAPDATRSVVAAKCVVVGVSQHPGGQAALRFAVAEAKRRNAEVLALRCWAGPVRYGSGSGGAGSVDPARIELVRAAERAVLDDCVRPVQLEYPDVAIRPLLVESAPDQALVASLTQRRPVGCRLPTRGRQPVFAARSIGCLVDAQLRDSDRRGRPSTQQDGMNPDRALADARSLPGIVEVIDGLAPAAWSSSIIN